MHMLYDSEHFAVVAFEVPAAQGTAAADGRGAADAAPTLSRGGYEIVDKFACKEIFLEGALAAHFQQGVQQIVDSGPTEEQLDEYIGRFTVLAQQPVVVH